VLSVASDDNACVYYSDRYRAQFFATLARVAFLVPAALGHLVMYTARWTGRWYVANRAEEWPAADALVTGSYEIDENQGILSRNGWEVDDDDDSEYHARFAVALQYSYRVSGEVHTGTYFLPDTYTEGDLAGEAERAWQGRKIIVRYNPSKPQQSFFHVHDGAPGRPHIPWMVSSRPYVTTLSLK
jgi:hypothetical protein